MVQDAGKPGKNLLRVSHTTTLQRGLQQLAGWELARSES